MNQVYSSSTELPMGHCVNHFVSVSMRCAFLWEDGWNAQCCSAKSCVNIWYFCSAEALFYCIFYCLQLEVVPERSHNKIEEKNPSCLLFGLVSFNCSASIKEVFFEIKYFVSYRPKEMSHMSCARHSTVNTSVHVKEGLKSV